MIELDKPVEQLSEKEVREMWIDTFFWVLLFRPTWFLEVKERLRKMRGQKIE